MSTVNDEDKKLLVARYADLKWVDAIPSKFQCNRCDRVLIDHFISNCKHIFCLNCKNILGDENKTWKCPLCQEVVQEISCQDVKLEQKLYSKTIYCPNNKYGCSTATTLKELPDHLKVCDYNEEKILPMILKGKKARDEMLIEMDKIEQNYNKLFVNASAAQVKLLQFEKIGKDSKDEFDKKFEEIKNILRGKLTEISELKNVYENKLEGFEADQNKGSQQTGVNLGQLANEITITNVSSKNDVRSKLAQLESKIMFMKLKARPTSLLDELWQHEADLSWYMRDINTKLSKGTFELESPSFDLPYYSMSAKAKFKLNADDDFVMSLILTNNDNKKPITFDIPPAVYYILKSQRDTSEEDIIIHSFYSLGSEVDFKSAYVHKIMKKEKASDIEYNVNKSLLLEIRVEPPEMVKSAYSYDGTLLWAIDNYEKRKQMEDEEKVDGVLTPYFYTSPRGHRVQAQVCLNGDSKFERVGLTFKILFLQDARSKKAFLHKTTITIINASEPTDFFAKSVEKDIKDEAVYSVDFCKYEEIEKFTQRDTLFIKIQIVSLEENVADDDDDDEENVPIKSPKVKKTSKKSPLSFFKPKNVLTKKQ